MKQWLCAFLICTSAVIATAGEVYADAYITDDLVLAYPDPIRAHVNVPIDFRFVYYQRDNKHINWSLIGAPAWMSINAGGRVTGSPTGTAAAVTVTVRADVGSGSPSYVQRNFSVTVYDSDAGDTEIRFVATTGSNGAVGSKSAPWATLKYALDQVASGNGRLIYARGGTYTETYTWQEGGDSSPWNGKTFTAADYSELRGYPGETAILDCNHAGHGLWVYNGKYVWIDNFTIRNANRNERAGLMLGSAGTDGDNTENVIASDVVVSGSDWTDGSNVAGVFISCKNCWLSRAVTFNNKCTGAYGSCVTPHNSSNVLAYSDGQAGDMYVVDLKSYGSIVGGKIKHAGLKRLIAHNGESFDVQGWGGASTNSSVRYWVIKASEEGIHLAVTDDNAYTLGAMLIEHNTVVNARHKALGIGTAFLTTDAGTITKNIFYNDVSMAGTGEEDDRLMQLWTYTATATVAAYTSIVDYNLYYSPASSNIIRLGSSGTKDKSWSDWASLEEAHGRFADPVFANVGSGLLTVLVGSQAAAISGSDYAGAFKPGQSYGAVGQSNTTLLDFDGVATVIPMTPSFRTMRMDRKL